jgi:hypothetical protein
LIIDYSACKDISHKLFNYKLKHQTIKPKDISPPYHIVITRKNQGLLNFLRIKAIVNGREIYPLRKSEPVMITVMQNNPKVVITDGYHITKPIELVYHHLNTYYFKVICVIDNMQLLAGAMLLIVLFLVGLYSGIFIIKLFSIMPVVYFLFYYYINRKDFLQITPV